ncbi:hypothetical protein ACFFUB_10225 [Algimonas porphyrae]|uniref:DUF1579 domain-containing protein n=1 Tax=Algimonas porphyrae TaxID=1128113 RepID=A0ABQ5V1T0_9PROT|nr:hypothetical protein [Algimonas porphyrae]GLQ21510.1 hypothetical protein GCM10007854_24650 [Algimonas porphyrae]
MIRTTLVAATFALFAATGMASAQTTPIGAPPPTSEADAHPFEFLFGEWVGTAGGRTAAGPYEVTQTERVGPMLNGDIVVVNGTGYDDEGVAKFQALGIISKTPDGAGWHMKSWSGGRQGTFPIELDGTTYKWSLPAGPGAVMSYVATVKGDQWESIGTYNRDGMDPVETFRMTLKRTGDTGWPAASPVPTR